MIQILEFFLKFIDLFKMSLFLIFPVSDDQSTRWFYPQAHRLTHILGIFLMNSADYWNYNTLLIMELSKIGMTWILSGNIAILNWKYLLKNTLYSSLNLLLIQSIINFAWLSSSLRTTTHQLCSLQSKVFSHCLLVAKRLVL